MPKVTVIVAAYNCSHTLRCAIASICDQTYADFEAWIVGDACTDDSQQVVASFADPRLRWANLPHHIGSQSGPNNEGLRRARGEYIAYLGQDDLWFPWHLASLVDTIEQADADFVHAVVALRFPHQPPQAVGAPELHRSHANRFVPPSGWLHRRGILDRSGPWPDPAALINGVDFVLQRRASLAGYRFAGSGQLTVLKFPSPSWKTYARHQQFPQSASLADMRSDPLRFHDRLLTELVVAGAAREEDLRVRPALRHALRSIYYGLVEWYGLDRWPLARYLSWKHHRRRRRAFVDRGLSALPLSNLEQGPSDS